MRTRSLVAAPRSRRPKGPLIVAVVATVIVVPLVIRDLGGDNSSATGGPERASTSVVTTGSTTTSVTTTVTTTIPTVVLDPKWLPKGTVVHGETQQATLDRAAHRKDLLPTTTVAPATTTIPRTTTTTRSRP